MPIELTVNNIPFQYPTPGDEPGWGQPATDWASEVTDVLNLLFGPNDILDTSASISNNVSIATDIPKLLFNPGAVRSATIDYSIYRISTANPSGNAETGLMKIVYDNAASAGSKWSVTIFGVTGDAGVTFNILDNGQFQYKSSNINSIGYSGVMHFSAKSLGQ